MKLLLDQNLSRRLVPLLSPAFRGVRHVTQVGLAGATDIRIWRYARNHGFAVISKDSDFLHRAMICGHPPKVIHVQMGNAPTGHIARFLMSRRNDVRSFLSNDTESVLVLRS